MPLEDLIHKKRTVADLIRFIGNTSETDRGEVVKTPNYSILLGAGASVTSGVRSGQDLVREWKQQVFEESPHDNMTLEEFYLPGNAPSWYEENNCYSALFENRFDLQRHRRIFVEREVSKAKPSMGYAYLVKLIENGFFNTIFTTNFDDLLNEAFYRFSNNRPIVCAHDSSISGVMVTSTRPKIIKLHGDYLFENIKATLRETESLETNMKMKFQEFAKDFGLIVIGYSGQDRSIMDILNYLLQKEEYFKNGVFWCIRKGDNYISSELKKILWRDRVYYVEIDGFDELFAELNHQLNNGALPVDDTFLSRKHQENIIRELTDNPLLNPSGECKILVDDCKKLKYNFEDNMLNDYLSYLKKQKQDDSKKADAKNARRKIKLNEMTADEKRIIDDLMTEGFVLKHTDSVLQKLDKMEIASLEDGQFKLELMELKADLTKSMNDETIKVFFEELIKLDPDNQRYYEISANRSKSNQQAIRFLNMAVEKYPNDAYIINKLIERLLDYCEEECPAEECENELNKIQNLLDKSLILKPQIENDAYSYKYRYFRMRYRNKPQEFRNKLNELCEKLIAVSRYHPNTLYVMRKVDFKELDSDYYMKAIDFYKKADNCRNVENCYIEYISYVCDKDSFDIVINLFKEYESEFVASNNFKFVKARVLMENEYLEDALIILDELPLDEEVTRKKMALLSVLGREEEVDSLYEASDYKDILKPHYLALKEKYQEEKEYYENKYNEKTSLSLTDAVSYAYVMLQCEDYQAVKKLLKPYYDNPMLAEGAVIVNYLFARKKSGEDIASKLKSKIIDNKYLEFSDFEKLGAYCVLGEKDKAYTCLQKVIKKEPFQKYIISKWPVLAPFINDVRFINILKPDHKRL